MTALYRMFDQRNDLLYVGISLSFPARFATHVRERAWAAEVTRMTVEQFPTRADALRAEAAAILVENPRYNRQRPGAKARVHVMPADNPQAEYQRRWRAKHGARTGQPGPPPTQPCGTTAAYKRHQRRGEAFCDPCRAAWSAFQRELYRRRKKGTT